MCQCSGILGLRRLLCFRYSGCAGDAGMCYTIFILAYRVFKRMDVTGIVLWDPMSVLLFWVFGYYSCYGCLGFMGVWVLQQYLDATGGWVLRVFECCGCLVVTGVWLLCVFWISYVSCVLM